MLGAIDRVVAVGSWVLAAGLAVMLFAGPALVAEDKGPAAKPASGSPYENGGGAGGVDAKALFTQNCGACHTLAAAGTSGTTGPVLDGIPAAAVEQAMVAGPGVMPEFGNELSAGDRRAIAQFVESSR